MENESCHNLQKLAKALMQQKVSLGLSRAHVLQEWSLSWLALVTPFCAVCLSGAQR